MDQEVSAPTESSDITSFDAADEAYESSVDADALSDEGEMEDSFSEEAESDEGLEPEGLDEADDESADESETTDELEDRNYTRGEYKKVVNEARNLRQRVQQYESSFGGWSRDDQGVWLSAIAAADQDPVQGAAFLREMADALDEGGAGDEGEGPVDEDGQELLTPAQVQQMIAQQLSQRDYQVELSQATNQITTRATELGYESGSKGFELILSLLSTGVAADVDEAHEALSGFSQHKVDDYVASKKQNAKRVPKPATGAATSPGSQEIKSFDDADRLAKML